MYPFTLIVKPTFNGYEYFQCMYVHTHTCIHIPGQMREQLMMSLDTVYEDIILLEI